MIILILPRSGGRSDLKERISSLQASPTEDCRGSKASPISASYAQLIRYKTSEEQSGSV